MDRITDSKNALCKCGIVCEADNDKTYVFYVTDHKYGIMSGKKADGLELPRHHWESGIEHLEDECVTYAINYLDNILNIYPTKMYLQLYFYNHKEIPKGAFLYAQEYRKHEGIEMGMEGYRIVEMEDVIEELAEIKKLF